MSLIHVSKVLSNPIKIACVKVDIPYCNVPIDGKPHETGLLDDKTGQAHGFILRALGGVCGQVVNNRTGQSLLFISLPEVAL